MSRALALPSAPRGDVGKEVCESYRRHQPRDSQEIECGGEEVGCELIGAEADEASLAEVARRSFIQPKTYSTCLRRRDLLPPLA
jgi:hypothetical protein